MIDKSKPIYRYKVDLDWAIDEGYSGLLNCIYINGKRIKVEDTNSKGIVIKDKEAYKNAGLSIKNDYKWRMHHRYYIFSNTYYPDLAVEVKVGRSYTTFREQPQGYSDMKLIVQKKMPVIRQVWESIYRTTHNQISE
jgi:hypothetical protein